jgi:hypothetical protein
MENYEPLAYIGTRVQVGPGEHYPDILQYPADQAYAQAVKPARDPVDIYGARPGKQYETYP